MSKLNDGQQAAVNHVSGAMLVLAGPGSGKTTVIVSRVLNLIKEHNIDGSNILVITFTKAATEEMKQRFSRLAQLSPTRQEHNDWRRDVCFSTFHALFYRILNASRVGSQTILAEGERMDAVRAILSELALSSGSSINTDDETCQLAANEISRVKNELIELQYYNSPNFAGEDFVRVYHAYEEYKANNNAMDFDDMLQKCYELLTHSPQALTYWQNKYTHIMIDEFQDINQAQYNVVKLLSNDGKNLFVVGDDDQSIYRFRGSRPEFLLRFPHDFPDTACVTLTTNYRSTEPIIDFCNRVISQNNTRYSKTMIGTGRTGKAPFFTLCDDVNAEAQFTARQVRRLIGKHCSPDDIAVIYRVNRQSRAIADAFMNSNIPYMIKDVFPSVYEHWIALDIYAYLKLSYDTSSNECLKRIINKPGRYISNLLITSALKGNGSLLKKLARQERLQAWQLARLEKLSKDLAMLARLEPWQAIRYLRGNVGYDGYINKISAYRHISPVGLFEVLDELQEAAKNFGTTREFAEHMQNAVMAAKEQKHKFVNDKPAVLLSTMHSAKGLEFDTVFIIGATEGSIPHEKSTTEQEIEEERRLFYVGLTRAKSHLVITSVKNRYEAKATPTRFLRGVIDTGEDAQLARERVTNKITGFRRVNIMTFMNHDAHES